MDTYDIAVLTILALGVVALLVIYYRFTQKRLEILKKDKGKSDGNTGAEK